MIHAIYLSIIVVLLLCLWMSWQFIKDLRALRVHGRQVEQSYRNVIEAFKRESVAKDDYIGALKAEIEVLGASRADGAA